MDFKVQVSLWTQAPGQSLPNNMPNQGRDNFAGKLGLQGQAQPEHEPHGQQLLRDANQDKQPWQHPNATASLSGSEDQNRQGMEALFELGLLAGPKLSYLSQAMAELDAQQTGGSLSSTPAANDLNLSSQARATDQPAARPAAPLSTAAQQIQTRQTAVTSNAQATNAAQLAQHLAHHWPQRNLLVLPKGQGVEVLVRDYQLSSEEREQLSAELIARLANAPGGAEQIWINGEMVWQKPDTLLPQGKHHGY